MEFPLQQYSLNQLYLAVKIILLKVCRLIINLKHSFAHTIQQQGWVSQTPRI